MEKEEDKYIVALELGTSKMIGIVARKSQDEPVTIIAIEKEKSDNCIKRGCIQNIDEAAARVKKLITKLSNRIPELKIERVYVSIAGQSIHSISHEVRKKLPHETEISQSLISELLSEAYNYPLPQAEILNIIPNEYLIDQQQENNPVGVLGSSIEIKLKLITARQSLKRKLMLCVAEKAQIPIAGFITAPLATAEALLTDEEKRLGCALIDFGAGTTTLSVYKDNMLRHLVTIPFGGRNITNDICTLNLLEESAEKIKRTFGKAIDMEEYTPSKSAIDELEIHRIKYETLCHVVEARIEEIVSNIVAQLQESGYKQQLPAGLIITGGASQLKGLETLLEQKTGLSTRHGNIVKNITLGNKSDVIIPEYTQAIGLALLGKEACAIKPEPVVVPPKFDPEEIPVKVPASRGGLFDQLLAAGKKLANKTEKFLDEKE